MYMAFPLHYSTPGICISLSFMSQAGGGGHCVPPPPKKKKKLSIYKFGQKSGEVPIRVLVYIFLFCLLACLSKYAVGNFRSLHVPLCRYWNNRRQKVSRYICLNLWPKLYNFVFYFLSNFSLGQFPTWNWNWNWNFLYYGIDVIVVVAFISYWIVIFLGRSIMIKFSVFDKAIYARLTT